MPSDDPPDDLPDLGAHKIRRGDHRDARPLLIGLSLFSVLALLFLFHSAGILSRRSALAVAITATVSGAALLLMLTVYEVVWERDADD